MPVRPHFLYKEGEIMDRVVEVKVNGSYLTKDNQVAGVQGEANSTALRIEFDEGWDGFAKTITWYNAKGENPTSRVLTADILEDITASRRIYLTLIPAEALTTAGKCLFVIDGYVNGKRRKSVYGEMVVKADPQGVDTTISDPTPSQAEQLQVQIDSMLDDVTEQAEIATQKADDAASSASAAALSASNAEISESAAKASETAAKASETAAAGSATSAAESAVAATTSASAAAESAEAAADSETVAKASEEAAKASETAAKSSETAAKASEEAAKSSETAAKSSETSAAGSASEAADSATSALTSASIAAQQADAASISADNAAGAAQAAEAAAAHAEEVVGGDFSTRTEVETAKQEAITEATAASRPVTWTPTAEEVGAIPYSEKGVSNGVATLDENGKVHDAQLSNVIAGLSSIQTRVNRLEDSLYNDITGNPHSVTFDSLDGVTVTGVWNANSARLEC